MPRILLMVLIAGLCLISSTPATIAQSGCAVSPALATTPAQTTPPAAIGLAFADSSGGALNAVAADDRGTLLGGGAAVFGFGTRVALPDQVRDMALFGEYAAVAAGSAGFQVVALDASASTPSAALQLSGLATGVAVSNNRAYVAAAGAGGGLHVLDISNPQMPGLLGSVPTYGSASAVAVAGSYAYIAGGLGGGIEIFDITNPLSPTLRGGLITPGNAQGIAVAGSRAYLAGGVCGLQVLDIADPARPQLLGAAASGGEALAVALTSDGTRAVVAGGAGGSASYTLFDVSALPARPIAQDTFGETQFLNDVAIYADQALLVGGGLRVQVPLAAPSQAETFPGETFDGALSLAVRTNDVLLGLAGGEILSFAAQPPLEPDIGALPTEISFAIDDLVVGPEALYIAAGAGGLISVNTGFPQGITQTLELSGTVRALSLNDNLLYAAAGEGGVHIIDLSSPLTPTLQSTVAISGTALDLALLPQNAIAVANRSGAVMIDSDGGLVGNYSAPPGSFVQAIAVQGAYAYLADRSGLIVLDISDSSNPRPIGSYDGFSAYNLTINNNRLYVAGGPDGVYVFALDNPAVPRLLGAYNTPGSALDVALSNGFVYIADNHGGLVVLRQIILDRQLYFPWVAQP